MHNPTTITRYILQELHLEAPYSTDEAILRQRMLAANNLRFILQKYQQLGLLATFPQGIGASDLYHFIQRIAEQGERGYSITATQAAIKDVIDACFDIHTETTWKALLTHLKKTYPLLELRHHEIPRPFDK